MKWVSCWERDDENLPNSELKSVFEWINLQVSLLFSGNVSWKSSCCLTSTLLMASPHDSERGFKLQFNFKTFCQLKKKITLRLSFFSFQEWFTRHTKLLSVKIWEKGGVLVDDHEHCVSVSFFPARRIFSASPHLLLREDQFYLAVLKQVKSKAENYFQVRRPGHPCLQVVELWFDDFSQQRRSEPRWNTSPAVVTFITAAQSRAGAAQAQFLLSE